MRTTRSFSVLALVAFFVLVPAACHVGAAESGDATYYAVEINDKLCGYSTLTESSASIDGREMTVVEQEVFAMVSVLGSRFNTEISSRFVVDPVTEQVVEAESEIRQGPTTTSFSARIDGRTAHFRSSLSPQDKTLELAPDVLFENPMYLHHVLRDFVGTDTQEQTYDTFQLIEGEVQPVRYTRVGNESLKLSHTSYDTLVVDSENLKTAVKMRIWIDLTDARPLKLDLPSGREVYLSDAAVKKKVEVVNLDETIIAKVDVSIADIQAISYMKVRAKIDPIGLQVTPESLNVPGQKFTGTVEDNLVEGVFEIEHPIYDGTNAPPFPPDFADDETLRPFLEPGSLIDSADPVLVAAARDITTGSRDSWEAVQRLAGWVANEIDYAIPGGGTARRTYDMRAGECGSHSNLLAAFSRAVGIPARVVWGCMYVPNFGGAFGQHGWNEVYMGPETGWVPLDATAFETSHADSGHIRIGVHEALSTALNPIEMEVLDYRVSGTTTASVAELEARYERFTGMYSNAEAQMGIELRVQDGSLVVDIPEKVVLPLDDPGEDGKWPCKLTDRVFATFDTDDEGKASSMKLHELVRMRKTSSPETIDESVPAELRSHLGKYMLAALNAEFTVVYEDGGLAVHDPLRDDTVQLQSPDADGGWLDEYDKNTIYFEKDEAGEVIELTVDSVTTFRRA